MIDTALQSRITLDIATEADMPRFRQDLKEAFATAVAETFGSEDGAPIPEDEDIDADFADENSMVLRVLEDGRWVGGAIVSVDGETARGELRLFYIQASEIGRGLGRKAWAAIESAYPDVRTWVTHTPYFEKRNIHFYVNVCGFHITDYFHSRHQDESHPPGPDFPDDGGMFRFEKRR